MTITISNVTRLWGTGVLVGELPIETFVRAPMAGIPTTGPPYEQVPVAHALIEPAFLEAEVKEAMADIAEGQTQTPPAEIELRVQIWRGGYDLPQAAHPADLLAWCFLSASLPVHEESGAISLADPRAGSAQTAMPGLPWGRQVMIRARAGAFIAHPGWLTHSIVPLERDQHAVVAFAASR